MPGDTVFEAKIISASAYRFAQKGSWVNPVPLVAFYVSGLRWLRYAASEMREFHPHLSLRTAGEEVEFEYGPDRENWVVQFETSDLRPGTTPDQRNIPLPP